MKRYDIDYDYLEGYIKDNVEIDGEWVKHSDHEAEVKKLTKIIDDKTGKMMDSKRSFDLKFKVDYLEAENKNLLMEIEVIADQYTYSKVPMTPQAELIKKRGLMVEENKRLRRACGHSKNVLEKYRGDMITKSPIFSNRINEIDGALYEISKA